MRRSASMIDRCMELMLNGFCRTALYTPPSVGLAIGRLLGELLCQADARHRHIAQANLKFAFQNRFDDRQISRLVQKNFRQWGMIAYEWSRMRFFDRLPRGRLPYRIEVDGLENLARARQGNAAVLLLSAHFGNWEYGHLYYASAINTLNFIVRRIDHPLLEEKRIAVNRQHGVTILYKESGLKAAIRNLRKGQDLVIFADQKANIKEGIACRFFGRHTTTLPILAALAQKYRLPIVPMFTVRKKNSAVHRLIFKPQLPMAPQDSIADTTQRQNDAIEAMIRQHPDHWLWMHRKWRTEHPEIYK